MMVTILTIYIFIGITIACIGGFSKEINKKIFVAGMSLAVEGKSIPHWRILAFKIILSIIAIMLWPIFVKSWFAGKQPRTLLEQVEEVGGKLIIEGYRRIAAIKGCAPSLKTSDKKIIEIYSKVGSAFRQAAMQRRELIPAENLNFIVWKFFQVYEMMGNEMLDSHLQYEVEKYLTEGLRPEYRNELALF
jgi:hypothetical protein